jgi:hypothetical protein
MKSIWHSVIFCFLVLPVWAQKGVNAWALEAGIGIGAANQKAALYPGINSKYLKGVGRSGQVAASVGAWFRKDGNYTSVYMPVSLGYRFNGTGTYNGIGSYIEPAAGLGLYIDRSIYTDNVSRPLSAYSEPVFMSSLDIGFKKKNLTAALQGQVVVQGFLFMPEAWPLFSLKLGYQF